MPSTTAPSGAPRVTIPTVLSRPPLIGHIAAFTTEHPNVGLHIDFPDVRWDLIADRIDVAIRMGSLKVSALIARQPHMVEPRLVVAPADMASPGSTRAWRSSRRSYDRGGLRYRRTHPRPARLGGLPRSASTPSGPRTPPSDGRTAGFVAYLAETDWNS